MSVTRRSNVDATYNNLISFVPEQQYKNVRETQERTRRTREDAAQGEEVKHFYESLLVEDSNHTSSSTPASSSGVQCHRERKNKTRREKRKRKARLSSSEVPTGNVATQGSTDIRQRDLFKLLQCAETGDSVELSRLVDTGLNINLQDMYGWTPLMCAARAGHLECVRLCLRLGADRDVRNSAGGTAKDLARSAGHLDVVAVMSSFSNQADLPSEDTGWETEAGEPSWCEVCKTSVSAKESKSHNTSMVHLFNVGHKPAPPAYLIPESNRGFQMLLRTGWELDRGLGPRGEGHKYPVRTVLKHDRKGLGVDQAESKKSKVTHFDAFDRNAVAQHNIKPTRTISARKSAQKALKAKERRTRRWERDIRQDLSL